MRRNPTLQNHTAQRHRRNTNHRLTISNTKASFPLSKIIPRRLTMQRLTVRYFPRGPPAHFPHSAPQCLSLEKIPRISTVSTILPSNKADPPLARNNAPPRASEINKIAAPCRAVPAGDSVKGCCCAYIHPSAPVTAATSHGDAR